MQTVPRYYQCPQDSAEPSREGQGRTSRFLSWMAALRSRACSAEVRSSTPRDESLTCGEISKVSSIPPLFIRGSSSAATPALLYCCTSRHRGSPNRAAAALPRLVLVPYGAAITSSFGISMTSSRSTLSFHPLDCRAAAAAADAVWRRGGGGQTETRASWKPTLMQLPCGRARGSACSALPGKEQWRKDAGRHGKQVCCSRGLFEMEKGPWEGRGVERVG